MTTEKMKIQSLEVFSHASPSGQSEDCAAGDREKRIFCVADGFGAGAAGEQAARTACQAVERFLYKEAGDLDATLPFVLRPYFSLAGNVLFNALIHANRECRKLNAGKSAQSAGGTSLVAGFVDGNLLSLGSVGGCEAWLWRGGAWVRLVQPRTFGFLEDPWNGGRLPDGRIPGAARVPLRALGMADDLEPELTEVRIQAGDALLLHTDAWSELQRQTWQNGFAAGMEPSQLLRQVESTIKVDHMAGVWAVFDK